MSALNSFLYNDYVSDLFLWHALSHVELKPLYITYYNLFYTVVTK